VSGQPSSREREIRIIYRILSHRLFRQVIQRQGIDFTQRWWRSFDGMIFSAMRRCAACGSRDACRAWLAEDRPRESCPSFCPNGGVIEACRILNPRAAPPAPEEVEIAGRREPPLAELLADPIVRQLMDADRKEGRTRHASGRS
jgi:Family of unknown function (DUF6455)